MRGILSIYSLREASVARLWRILWLMKYILPNYMALLTELARELGDDNVELDREQLVEAEK